MPKQENRGIGKFGLALANKVYSDRMNEPFHPSEEGKRRNLGG
jgi:hypothetical protein